MIINQKAPARGRGFLFFIAFVVAFGGSVITASDIFDKWLFGRDESNQITQTNSVQGQIKGETTEEPSKQNVNAGNQPQVLGQVKAAEDEITENSLVFRLKVFFLDTIHGISAKFDTDVEVGNDLSVGNNLQVENDLEVGNDLIVNGELITEDDITAPNVVYSITAGTGVSLSGTQDITITNTDLGSSQNIFKNFKIGSNTVSADSNNDTLTWASGTGISLSNDGKTITISASGSDLNVSGWTDDGTAIRLTTSTDNVGIGTDTPGYKLHVVGTSYFSGQATFAGGTVISSGIDNSSGGITNAGPITGATGLTSSGTITFSGLSTGIIHSNGSGVLSSSALNLAGGSTEITGTLPIVNGGTGLTSYATGDIIYSSATNTLTKLGIGATDEVLTVAGGVPTWATITGGGGLCSNCLVDDPGSTQTINPTAAAAVGLVIKQASSGSVDTFRVESNDGSNVYFKVDSSGNVTLGNQTSSGVFTVSPSGTDPIAISPVAQGAGQFTGTITSEDLTAARSWTFPDATGAVCLTTGNCAGVGGQIGGSGTTNYIAKFSNSSNITTSLLYDDGNNVGLGTSSPVHLFQVMGAKIGKALTALNETGDQAIFVASASGTNRFIIQNDGNVGIGTSTPTSLFHVNGTVDFDSTFGVNGATTLGSTLDVTGLATFGGNVGIGTTTPTSALQVYGTDPQIRLTRNGGYTLTFDAFDGGGSPNIVSSGPSLKFLTSTSNNFLTTADNAFGTLNGHLGVAVTGLYVTGKGVNSYVTSAFRSANSNQTGDLIRMYDSSNDILGQFVPISTTDQRLRFVLYNTLETTVTNYERLTIYPDTTNSIFRIEAESGGTGTLRNLVLQGGGGNVGIASIAPGRTLDVVGTGRITDTGSTTPVLTIDQNDSSNNATTLRLEHGGGGENSRRIIEAISGGSEVFRLFPTGKIETIVNGGSTDYDAAIFNQTDTSTAHAGAALQLNHYGTGAGSSRVLTAFNAAGGSPSEIMFLQPDGTFYVRGNAGVGTTAPIGKLNVEGAAIGKALAILNETGDQAIFVASASGTNRFIIQNGGNVGIGSITPAANLHVYQESPTPNQIMFQVGTGAVATRFTVDEDGDGHFGGDVDFRTLLTGNGTVTGPSHSFVNDTNLGMYRYGTDTLSLATADADRLIIDASGNIGIGTTSPGTQLELYKGVGSNPQIYFTDADTSHGVTDIMPASTFSKITNVSNTTGGIQLTGINTQVANSAPSVLLYGIRDGGNGNAVVSVRGGHRSGTGVTTVPGNGQLFTVESYDATTRYFTINGTGQTTINGDGFGTQDFFLTNYTSSIGDTGVFRNTHASYTGSLLRVESARTASNAYNLLELITDYDGTPVTQLLVQGNGNVGIGTSDPSSAQLELYGNKIHIRLFDTFGSGAIIRETSDNLILQSQAGSIIGVSGAADGTTSFQFQNSSSVSRFNVNDLGYVGIGVNTTASVDSDTAAVNINGAKTGKALFGLNETGDQAVLTASVSGVTKFIIDNAGNIGIGTALPAVDFHHYINTTSTTPQFRIENDGTGDSALTFLLTGEAGWSMGVDNSDSNKFKLAYATNSLTNNLALTVLSNGNVGIGTASPNSVLNLASGAFTIGTNGDCNNDFCLDSDSIDTFWDYTIRNHNSGSLYLMPDGNVGIGTTTTTAQLDVFDNAASAYSAEFFNDGNDANRYGILVQSGLDDQTAAGPSTLVQFNDGDGGAVGSITFGLSLTNYNTTSDVRLKDVSGVSSKGLPDLMNINVYDYSFKADSNKRQHTGFSAQELYQIYPDAVTAYLDDTSKYWQVDYGKLTPLIIKSIQDQQKQVTDLALKLDKTGALVSQMGKVLGTDQNQESDDAQQVNTNILAELLNTYISLDGIWNFLLEVRFKASATFESAVQFLSTVVFKQDVVIDGNLIVSRNQAGSLVVPVGDRGVKVTFSEHVDQVPVVIATPTQSIVGNYWVTDISKSGFTIAISQAQDTAIVFNWHIVTVNESGGVHFEPLKFDTAIQPQETDQHSTQEAESTHLPETISQEEATEFAVLGASDSGELTE